MSSSVVGWSGSVKRSVEVKLEYRAAGADWLGVRKLEGVRPPSGRAGGRGPGCSFAAGTFGDGGEAPRPVRNASG